MHTKVLFTPFEISPLPFIFLRFEETLPSPPMQEHNAALAEITSSYKVCCVGGREGEREEGGRGAF